jgi:hypothetical protein
MNDQNAPRLPLDESTAFNAMRLFLKAYWERGGRASDELAVLLGGLERLQSNGMPLDPALWSDWIEAVGKASSKVR